MLQQPPFASGNRPTAIQGCECPLNTQTGTDMLPGDWTFCVRSAAGKKMYVLHLIRAVWISCKRRLMGSNKMTGIRGCKIKKTDQNFPAP